MELVVGLALLVLAAVFLFSLFLLILMCKRRIDTSKKFKAANSLRFSKLTDDNMEAVEQLSPWIAHVLDNNQWIYDVTGMLEHCVSILKLCHTLTENLSSVSLNSVNPQLNKAMLTATHRIMPQFDDVIRAMATAQVDLRLLEARLSSLVTACWALTVPFLLACPKSAGNLGSIQKQMDEHVEALRMVIDLAEKKSVSKRGHVIAELNRPLNTIVEEEVVTGSFPPTVESTAVPGDDSEAPADPAASG